MKATRALQWVLGCGAGACLLQAGGCLSNEIVLNQVANILTDTVFFLLDNALVRLTT
ncbi:MAG: hypothetical protein IPM18_04480 [Phycisphaerales bacterium]|nr:hypothetical protein [Phycisphaerales bacterium]